MKLYRIILIILLLGFTIVGRSEAQLGMSWVGSTGVVDSASEGRVRTVGGAVYLKPEISTGRAVLRYNVPPINRLLRDSTEGERRWFNVRLADNGPAAQVLVLLREYNFHTGAVRTLLTLDSNNFPAAEGFHGVSGTFSEEQRSFDFHFADGSGFGGDNEGRSFYYVEVHLIRTSAGGNPAIAGIALISDSP
jgi:hypothetical protein